MSQAAAVRAEFRARLDRISIANGYKTNWSGVLHYSEVEGSHQAPPVLVFTPLELRAQQHRPNSAMVDGRYAVEALVPWSPAGQDAVDDAALDIQRALFVGAWDALISLQLEELQHIYPEAGGTIAVVSLIVTGRFVERY